MLSSAISGAARVRAGAKESGREGSVDTGQTEHVLDDLIGSFFGWVGGSAIRRRRLRTRPSGSDVETTSPCGSRPGVQVDQLLIPSEIAPHVEPLFDSAYEVDSRGTSIR